MIKIDTYLIAMLYNSHENCDIYFLHKYLEKQHIIKYEIKQKL